MELEGNNYCVLPFTHLAIEANGEVKGCCLTPAFKTKSGEPFNLNKRSSSEILFLEDRREFIESFRRGERHPYCKECWDKEDHGCTSNRIKFTNEVLGYEEFKGSLDSNSPKYIEIKMGNACNLKCAICSPINSSLWAKEVKEYGGGRTVPSVHHSDWVRNSDLWDSSFFQSAKIVHLMGGEPLLQRRNKQLLERLVSSGKAADCHLRYNTNGTIYDGRIVELFENFKTVRINFSLDDVGKRFEYQRFPARFEQVMENVERFAQAKLSNVILSIDICWSFLNIYHCKEILEFYGTLSREVLGRRDEALAYDRHFYVGDLYDSAAMNEEERQLYVKRIDQATQGFSEEYKGLFLEMKKFVTEKPFDEKARTRRDERIRQMDRFRSLKYSDAYGDDS